MKQLNCISFILCIILLSSCRAMFPIFPRNKVLAKEIREMATLDNKYRGKFPLIGEKDCMPVEKFIYNVDEIKGKKFTFTKESYDKIFQEQRKLDSINVVTFIQLVEEHGFPTEKKIGGLNFTGNLISLILHFPHFEHLVGEHIKEAAIKGDLPKWCYMYFYDRAQMVKDKPCLYYAIPQACDGPMDEELTKIAREKLEEMIVSFKNKKGEN